MISNFKFGKESIEEFDNTMELNILPNGYVMYDRNENNLSFMLLQDVEPNHDNFLTKSQFIEIMNKNFANIDLDGLL